MKPFVEIIVTPLFDNRYRIERVKVLRDLDPEVKRVYQSELPFLTVTSDRNRVILYWKKNEEETIHGALNANTTIPNSLFQLLEICSNKLRQIEKLKADFGEAQQVTLTIGGDE